MSPRKPLSTEEIAELLSKLKAETPEYPPEMMAARKAAFLKQAVNIKLDQTGHGGEGGQQGGSGGSGGSGAMLSGGSAPGFLLQVLILIAVIAGLLLAAYAYQNQRDDNPQVSRIGVQEDTINSTLAPESVTVIPSSTTSVLTPSPSIAAPTEVLSILEDVDLEDVELNGAEVIEENLTNNVVPEITHTNSGLHLGQTPGTPAAPGQGNPNNLNKPDKPDKPDKPNKPDKPDKSKK